MSGDVQRETTEQRTDRLRRSGAVMCSRGQPLTETDLDAVESFMAYLRGKPKAQTGDDHGKNRG